MNESVLKINAKTNELETVTEEPIIRNKTFKEYKEEQKSQERNSRLDTISKAQGVKRLSLSRNSVTGQVQPQTPASCPNRSPLSCMNVSINEPMSAVEKTNKLLMFHEGDNPTGSGGGSSSIGRKISRNLPSLSSAMNTSRPPLSMLSILAAKRITRKFLSTFADDKYHRDLNAFSRLSSFSPASFNVVSFLPTYQLGPKEVFNVTSVQSVIEQLMNTRIESLPSIYDEKKANRLCTTLGNEIKALLKTYGKDRYRYIVYCVVMQNCKQMAGFTNRVLWDMNYDRCFHLTQNISSYFFDFKDMSAVAESLPSETKRSKIENGLSTNTVCLRFKKLSDQATPPTRGSAFAAGYDLYSAQDTTIPVGGRGLVKTDIQIELPDGCYGRVAPRSGLALKNGIDVGAGVIDQDYRGNLGVVLFNFGEQDFEVSC
ncbi:unnamed protein product [Heterobilharzia americana]|nr:unnamed protein product [Heterobilharzia americana]